MCKSKASIGQCEHHISSKYKDNKSKYLKGFPLLKAKLELTIMATQKAMKKTRNTTSLHFLLCLMMPLLLPPISVEAGCVVLTTAPNGPLILEQPQDCTLFLLIFGLGGQDLGVNIKN